MKKNTRIKHKKYDRRKKYIFPLVALSILLVVSVMGVFATAGDTFPDPLTGLQYKVITEYIPADQSDGTEAKNGTVAITGYDSSGGNLGNPAISEGKLTIPAIVALTRDINGEEDGDGELASYNIVSIDSNAFKDNTSLTSIDFSLATNLETIGDGVFKTFAELTSLDLSGATKLTSIGDGAFSECERLTSVTLPASLKSLGNETFGNCVNLNSVDFSESSELTTIGDGAFYNCPWLTDIKNLPSGASIGNDAFWGCCYLSADTFTDDPFKTDVFLDAELRGTSIAKIIPAKGIEVTTVSEAAKDKIPAHFFRGQQYQITFAPAAAREIKELDLLTSIRNLPTEGYDINDNLFKEVSGKSNTFEFAIPNEDDFPNNIIYLLAIATTGNKTSGAPTIITDKLDTATKGKPYEFQLTASPDENLTWSLETAEGASSALPDDFKFDSSTGKITSAEVTSNAGEYKFIAVANNDVSTHKRELTLKVFENKLLNFENDSLWWETRNGNTFVVWKPLVNPGADSIKYTVQIYDEKGNFAGADSKDLQSSFTSEFAEIDVTNIINGKKGTYTYKITASNNEYGSSSADSSDTSKYPRGTYPYGYEEYTITAVAAGGTGTGKISISEKSYNDIPTLVADNIDNGITVTVIETAVSEKTPLTFLFTPDKGCETTGVTVNNMAVNEKESFTFTSLEMSNSSSSSRNSEVVMADESDNVHDIVVEFSLISNTIGGGITEKTSYIQKEKVHFQAFGHNMDLTGVVKGNTRWVPDYWWLDDQKVTETTTKHIWNGEPYTDTIDTTNLSLGDHVLYVSFKQQTHDGAKWVDSGSVNSTDVRSVTFEVTDRSGNATDPNDPDGSEDTSDDTSKENEGAGTTDDENKKDDDKKDTNDKNDKSSGDKSSKDKSSSGVGSVVDRVTSVLSGVDTSDDMVVGLWAALALASLIGIGFCIRQIIKFS